VNVLPSSRRFAVVAFAAVLILSGCHKKVVPAPPAAPPPPPPAPTAKISINPMVIDSGQSATLSWTTANADKVTISGFGPVDANGSSSVAPTRSTEYTVTATASNGAKAESSVRVTVNAPVIPPPAPAPMPTMTEEELFAQNVHDVFFDYDKYSLRPADAATATQDAAFLKSHASMKVVVEGNCDDRGSEEYNLALGESRAESLKKALIADGVDASRIKVISFGEEKPVCHEENESCWQQNRHDHVRLDHPGQ